jgi:amino acid transporter
MTAIIDRQLVRALTVVPAAAVILANIIGTGVFVKARVMICNVGTPGMVLTVWVVAGILTLAGALVYAELGTMMPRSGGEFHFVGAGFGRRWAFLYGWTKTVALGASNAAVAIIFVIFLNDLTGGALPPLAIQTLPCCKSSARSIHWPGCVSAGRRFLGRLRHGCHWRNLRGRAQQRQIGMEWFRRSNARCVVGLQRLGRYCPAWR